MVTPKWRKRVSTMTSNVKQIYICNNTIIEESCQWLLTDSMVHAKTIDPNFQLASVRDLLDWVAATGETFIGIVSVKEGLCKWFEREYVDEFGELSYECCYKMI